MITIISKLKYFGRFVKDLLPQKEATLIDLVEKEKKTDKQTQDILKKKSPPIWIPSVSSFFKVFILLLAFWFFIHYQPFKLSILESPENHYQSLIAIHAGIGAVLIGLAFFVAQSLTDKNDPEKGRVLLYKSYFFPLITAEILIFFLFFLEKISILSIIPIIVLAIFTILSLGRVITILIKDHEMEKAKKEMFFSIIKKSFIKILDREITKRFGNNKLNERLKDHKILELNPLGPSNIDDYIPLKSNKSGLFTNFSFIKLNEFISELRKFDSLNKSLIANLNTETTNQDSFTLRKEPFCYMSQMYYHNVKIGDALFWVKKDLFNTEIDTDKENRKIKHLENLAQNIFTIKEMYNPEEEAKDEVSKIKDRCIVAITNKQTGELRKSVRFYLELIKEFFNYLELYGGGFTREQAEEERGSFF